MTRSLVAFFRRRRALHGGRFVAFLWGDIYRGVQVGRVFVGWTNPFYKARGW